MPISKRDTTILAGIILIAFGLRITTYKYYLMGHDPFHHYAIAKYIIESGGFPGVWPLSLHPEGARITEPMGLYYVSVVLYRLLSPAGVSFFEAYKLSTPLFGALTLIPAFLIARHVFGSRNALMSLAALAVVPAFIYRTAAGYYRGDVFSVFFMVFGFYFFLTSLDGEIKKRLLRAVLAGVSLGGMGIVWNGFLFGFVVISGFVMVYSVVCYLRDRDPREVLMSYAIAAGLGIAIIKYSILLQPHAQAFINDLMRFIYPGTLLFAGFLFLMGRVVSLPRPRRVYLLGAIGVASAAAMVSVSPGFLGRLMTGYGLVIPTEALFASITELIPPSQEAVWRSFYLVSVLFVPGFLVLLRDVRKTWDKERVFMLIWVIASLYMLSAAVRYTFLAAVPITMVSIVFLFEIRKIDFLRGARVSSAAVLVLLLLIGSKGIGFAGGLGPMITEDWIEALDFLKEEEEGGVLVWWDYGSWIQGITGFPTTLDTVTGQNQRRMKEIGRLFLGEDGEAVRKGIEKYRVKYVVTSSDMILQLHNIYRILNTTGPSYIYFSYTDSSVEQGIPVDIYGSLRVYRLDNNRVVTYQRDMTTYSFNRSYRKEGGRLVISQVKTNLPSMDGAIYISDNDIYQPMLPSNFLLYIPEELEDTLLTSLILFNGKGFDALSLIYSNPQVQIYRVKG
jgi:dolichyl-diphosphooligosaccharide--protein glycosyltransferase